MRRRNLMITAAALIAVVTVGACSRSEGGGGGNGPAEVHGAPSAPASAGAAVPALQAARAGDNAAGVASGASDLAAVHTLESSAEIRTAQLTVTVEKASNVSAKADEADAIAIAQGGEVDADNRTSGRHATASLVLRVPPDALQTTLHQLAALGHERSRQLSTVDVTQRVADVNSRVTSARDAIKRLRTLYRRATKVKDLIAVENQLSSREADLESLEARQRALARKTALATIRLDLLTATHRKPPPPPPAKHRGGFVGGLERGWHGFVATASWLAAALGTVLPFLLLLLVLGIAGRLLWPRLKHHVPPSAPAE